MSHISAVSPTFRFLSPGVPNPNELRGASIIQAKILQGAIHACVCRGGGTIRYVIIKIFDCGVIL